MAKLLSGTRIYGNATVDTNLIVSGSTTSTNSGTGALTVAGGAGIVGNLNVGNILVVSAGIQNTPIGNGTASTGSFTTATASSSFNGPHNGTLGAAGGNTAIVSTLSATGNATVSALTVNGTATISSTLGVTGAITASSIATSGTTTGYLVNASGVSTGIALIAASGRSSGTTGALLYLGGNSNPSGSSGYLMNGQHTLSPQQDLSSWYGLLFLPTIQTFSGNIGSMYNEFLRLDTGATGNANITNWFGSFVATPSFTVGSAPVVNTWVGYYVQDPNNAVVNPGTAYAYRSNVNRGTNRWGAYFSGTADNYFAGNLGLGVTTPTSPLHVSGAGVLTGNLTAAALTVNGTATIGSTLGVVGNINGTGLTLSGSLQATGAGDFDGGLQSTPIGNAAPSTALFTTVGASSNATVAALTVNGAATVGTTLGVTGNVIAGNVSTAGNVNSNSFFTGNRGIVAFNDGDGSNYVGFKAPNAVGVNLIWTLPASDGSSGYVLSTDGLGTLSWAANGGGGGGGTTGGYFNSTLTAFPGATANIDYGSGETYVGQAATLDAFGISLVAVYSCNDPTGSIQSADLGAV